MLSRDEVEITLHRDFAYYKNLGYKLPFHIDSRGRKVSRGEKIMVKVKDLPPKSTVIIDAECDYCGKIYHPKYVNYYAGHKEVEKDSCSKCKHLKTKEIYLLKYKTTSLKTRSEIEGFKIGRKKIGIEIIYDEFHKHNLIPKFTKSDYVNTTTEVPYICEKHKDKGVQYTSYDALKYRKNCCKWGFAETMSENQSKSSIDDVKLLCDKKGYTLLTDFITSVDDKIEYICNSHEDYGIQTTSLWGLRTSTNSCRMCRQALISGANHWNWQGGIGLERDIIKQTPEYKKWRNDVFARDNYTCQCCFQYGVSLNAHHIENFSSNPELRTDLNNGITLCEDCHSVNKEGGFHNVYGVYNNNKNQLYEYIESKQLSLRKMA